MKLIAKPDELVVGRWYWYRNKRTASIACDSYDGVYSFRVLNPIYDIIECKTPTAQDFDRLIQETK